jgi:exodeoxyribonuclease-3
VITAEFDTYYVVTCYTPNSQNELKRLDYRMKWEDDFLGYLKELEKTKPVILCGDLNVAHTEIDLKNPKTNRGNAGFSDEERGKFSELLEAGFTDSWRYKHPEVTGVYSWWSYRFNARKNNAGWRIDYFVVSDILKDKIVHTDIYTEVYGSDHCPVELELDI